MSKTLENLKAAIIGETTASATYAAYAAIAAQEGYPLIQQLRVRNPSTRPIITKCS